MGEKGGSAISQWGTFPLRLPLPQCFHVGLYYFFSPQRTIAPFSVNIFWSHAEKMYKQFLAKTPRPVHLPA